MSCRYSGSRVEVYIVVVACGLMLVVQMQIERLELRIADKLSEIQCRCHANAMKESVNTNQITIHTDEASNRIRDILRKQGHVE